MNLLVLSDIGDGSLAKINTIAPELQVRIEDASFRLAMKALREPGSLSDEEQRLSESYKAPLADAEILLTGYLAPPELPGASPRLRWLHTMGAGVDRMLGTPLMSSDVVITNAGESTAGIVAEYALWLVLDLAKQGWKLARNQEARVWDAHVIPIALAGKTVAIIGLGAIGRTIARLCNAFDMRVIGTRRSADEPLQDGSLIDRIYAPDQLTAMLQDADFVVLAVPLTDDTHGLIGRQELGAMKKSAYLVNVARGKVVDEPALIDALRSGEIAGAGLDVFATEPLSPDSPLWTIENCTVVPHRAGVSDTRIEMSVGGFLENLRRYGAGEPLRGVVDKDRGY